MNSNKVNKLSLVINEHPDAITGECYQMFAEKLTPSFTNYSKKKQEGTLPNLFQEARHKHQTKRKLQSLLSQYPLTSQIIKETQKKYERNFFPSRRLKI